MELEESSYWVPAAEHSPFERLVTVHQCFRSELKYDYVSRFDDLHAGECDEVGCNAL